MVHPVPSDHPLRHLFQALVRRTFQQRLGVSEPGVHEYLSNLLAQFVHIDNIYSLRDARGRRLEEVAEMLAEGDVRLEARSFDREREVHRHVGDFTLFWSGVYPEALRLLRAPQRKDHLLDYIEQGRSSYYIASTFDYGVYEREAPVLRRLSEDFEVCMLGLHMVRDEWESLGDRQAHRVRTMLLE